MKSERNTLPSSMPDGRPGMGSRPGRKGGVFPESVIGNGRYQDVARAAHRLDELRVVHIGLDLLAQPADLNVDRAVEGRGLAAACLLEQEIARQLAMLERVMQLAQQPGAAAPR